MKHLYPFAAVLGFAAPLITADCETDWEECIKTQNPLACDAAKNVCEHPESAADEELNSPIK